MLVAAVVKLLAGLGKIIAFFVFLIKLVIVTVALVLAVVVALFSGKSLAKAWSDTMDKHFSKASEATPQS